MTVWRYGLGFLWFWLLKAEALSEDAGLRKRDGNTTAAPVVASISQHFEGNDGTWSSFQIQVGNKPQSIRVFPSTQSTTTWVVESLGCPQDAPKDCPDSRGGLFNTNNSLTWIPNSIYDLGLEEDLGFGGVNGDFGFDTVALGLPESGGPSVDHSIVAGIANTQLTWLGVLGLNPMPTNFSTFNNPQPSFLSLLRAKNLIPSLTWSYTAGAVYRFDKVFGSLVLGGYDAAKFTPSNLTFPFYQDIERNLLVGVQKITTDISSTSLVNDGFFALIDSTIPYLWLPEDVCDAFESAFGLTYNSTAQLYLINDTVHSNLVSKNPNVTFTIGPDQTGGATVDIVFPYAAFDLNISYPYVDGTSRYFPLKRGANSTQYTLGRAFLQEAYLIADFERSNFSVFPVNWVENAQSSIVAIRSINDTSSTSNPNGGNSTSGPTNSKSKSTPVGAIVGAVVGVIALLAVVGLIWWLHRTKRLVFSLRKKKSFELEAFGLQRDQDAALAEPYKKDAQGGELDGDQIHELHTNHKFGLLEAPSEVKLPMEMEAEVPRPLYEMEGTVPSGPADVKIPSQPSTPGQLDAVYRHGTPVSEPSAPTPTQPDAPWRGRTPAGTSPSPPVSRTVSPPIRAVSPPTQSSTPIPFGAPSRTATDMSIPSIVIPDSSPDPTHVETRSRVESGGTCVPFEREEQQKERSRSRGRRK